MSAAKVTAHAPAGRHAASGVTLGAMLLAFVLANSPARILYDTLHHLPVSMRVGALAIDKPLILWINEGLMVFFFLLMGLELKREVLEGQLSSVPAIAAPGFAALGGMAVPALMYIALNGADPIAMRGWAIPTATDTVLALMVLALLGTRVPISLKVFLTALAIFDDLGAILVIAVFYTQQLSVLSLVMALFGIIALIGLNVLNVTRTAAYVVAGAFLWVAVLESGVHATLAGVVIGLALPMSGKRDGRGFSPLREAEHSLQPWVSLGVVPAFAFFNSGLTLSASTLDALISPVSLGIVLGLIVGKPVGVFGATWLAVTLGIAKRPEGTNWGQLLGVAMVAGIGFTMSLFIAGLAFSDSAAFRSAKLSVIVGSLPSAVLGAAVLWLSRPRQARRARKQAAPGAGR